MQCGSRLCLRCDKEVHPKHVCQPERVLGGEGQALKWSETGSKINRFGTQNGVRGPVEASRGPNFDHFGTQNGVRGPLETPPGPTGALLGPICGPGSPLGKTEKRGGPAGN